ncbi:MAG: FxsA family protein [Candidatus Thiodiazotropha endolucinida]
MMKSIVLIIAIIVLSVIDALTGVTIYEVVGIYTYIFIYILLMIIGLSMLLFLKNKFKLAKNRVKAVMSDTDSPSVAEVKSLFKTIDMKIVSCYFSSVIFLLVPGVITSIFGVFCALYLFTVKL